MTAPIKILHLEDSLSDADLAGFRLKKNNVPFERIMIQCINLANIQNKKLGIIMPAPEITKRKPDEIELEKTTSDLIQHNKELEQFTNIVLHKPGTMLQMAISYKSATQEKININSAVRLKK